MPTVEGRFGALLVEEQDAFRLTIRAHALIDERVDELLALAFVKNLPGLMKGPNFKRKVDLAVALGLMSESFSALLLIVTKLRNDLAHGRADSVSPARAKLLFEAIRTLSAPRRRGARRLALRITGPSRHVVDSHTPHHLGRARRLSDVR